MTHGTRLTDVKLTHACPLGDPGSGLVTRAFLGLLSPEPPLQSIAASAATGLMNKKIKRPPPCAGPPAPRRPRERPRLSSGLRARVPLGHMLLRSVTGTRQGPAWDES